MTDWNEAIDAYDESFDILEATRADYREFLKAKLLEADQLVCDRTDRKIDFLYSAVAEDEEKARYLVAWVHKVMSRERAIWVEVWPSRPFDGPPGLMRVALSITNDLHKIDALPDDQAEIVAAAKAEVDALEGDPYNPRLHTDITTENRDYLRITSVALQNPELATNLADTMVAYAEAAEGLEQAIQRLAATTPNLWLRHGLVTFRDEQIKKPTLKSELPIKWSEREPLPEWLSGHFIELNVEGPGAAKDTEFWLLALPDNTVKASFGAPQKSDPDFITEFCERLGSPQIDVGGYPGCELFSADKIQEMFEEDNPAPLHDRLLSAAREFVGMVEGG